MLQQVHVQHSQLQPSPGQHGRVEEREGSVTALPVHLDSKASGPSAAEAEQARVNSCRKPLMVQGIMLTAWQHEQPHPGPRSYQCACCHSCDSPEVALPPGT